MSSQSYRADSEVKQYLKLNHYAPLHAEISFSRLVRQTVDQIRDILIPPPVRRGCLKLLFEDQGPLIVSFKKSMFACIEK